jgi:hypothetical protein
MAFALVLLLGLAASTPASTPGPAARADVPPSNDRNEVTIGRYRLQRLTGGAYEATTEVFTARIAADGAVTFKDRLRLPGQAVWPVLLAAEALRTATGGRDDEPAPAGQPILRPSIKRPTLVVSDEDLRRDPHHAAKMTFLETTGAFREGLRLNNERSALAAFGRHVQAVASDRARPPAQRRGDLFELWLDCDESPRGAPARALVESIAGRSFPAGGPQGYSAAELTRLNARAPQGLRFNPYPPPPPAPSPAPP